MNVTLKDLRRFEAAIGMAVEDLLRQAQKAMTLTLSAYDSDIERTLQAQQSKISDCVLEARALVALRYQLRRRIQESNAEVGIDKALNHAAQLQSEARTLSIFHRNPLLGMTTEALKPSTVTAIKAKFKSVLQNAGGAVARDDTADLNGVLSQEALDNYKVALTRIKRELDLVKDKIGSMNINSKVPLTLSNDQITLLQKHNIFYGVEG